MQAAAAAAGRGAASAERWGVGWRERTSGGRRLEIGDNEGVGS